MEALKKLLWRLEYTALTRKAFGIRDAWYLSGQWWEQFEEGEPPLFSWEAAEEDIRSCL